MILVLYLDLGCTKNGNNEEDARTVLAESCLFGDIYLIVT